jgi:hypothetical protein
MEMSLMSLIVKSIKMVAMCLKMIIVKINLNIPAPAEPRSLETDAWDA